MRQPVTPSQRARMERDVELLIELLDMLDGDTDREPEHEGCCDAGDDDPASSYPFVATGGKWGPGDPDDAEDSDGLEQTDEDMRGLREPPCHSYATPVPIPCGPGPLQLDSRTYASVREWRQARKGGAA